MSLDTENNQSDVHADPQLQSSKVPVQQKRTEDSFVNDGSKVCCDTGTKDITRRDCQIKAEVNPAKSLFAKRYQKHSDFHHPLPSVSRSQSVPGSRRNFLNIKDGHSRSKSSLKYGKLPPQNRVIFEPKVYHSKSRVANPGKLRDAEKTKNPVAARRNFHAQRTPTALPRSEKREGRNSICFICWTVVCGYCKKHALKSYQKLRKYILYYAIVLTAAAVCTGFGYYLFIKNVTEVLFGLGITIIYCCIISLIFEKGGLAKCMAQTLGNNTTDSSYLCTCCCCWCTRDVEEVQTMNRRQSRYARFRKDTNTDFIEEIIDVDNIDPSECPQMKTVCGTGSDSSSPGHSPVKAMLAAADVHRTEIKGDLISQYVRQDIESLRAAVLDSNKQPDDKVSSYKCINEAEEEIICEHYGQAVACNCVEFASR